MLHNATFLSRLFGILLLSVGSYSFFLACGASEGFGLECFDDDDCSGVCISGKCRETCDNDLECSAGYICQSRLRAEGDEVDICTEKTHIISSCKNDTDCQTKLNAPSAKCSIDRQCFIPQKLYALLLEDISPVMNAPTDGIPGSEFSAIYLTDTSGEIIGYAKTLIAQTHHGEKVASLIQGAPPNLDNNKKCVKGNIFDSVKIGIKGRLLVRFLDTKFRDYLETPSEWNINIIEWGENCKVFGSKDEYRVSICTTSSYENIDFSKECVQIGKGKGFSIFNASER